MSSATEGPPGDRRATVTVDRAASDTDGRAPDQGRTAGPRRRRIPRLAAVAVLAATAVAVAVVLLGPGSRSPRHTGSALPAGETTTTVGRRTLTESSTAEGTLGYGAEVDLYDRLAGTFTWLPAVGEVVRRGGTLWRIDNHPVVLMYGPVPAFRTLKEGVGDGPDVAELNRNLIDLGFDPFGEIEELAHFGAATAAAVSRWQEAEHLPVTGKVELGRIVFAPGARRVTGLEVSVGQDPPPLSQSQEGTEEAAPAAEEGPGGKEPGAEKPASEESKGGKPTGEPKGGKPSEEEKGKPAEEPEAGGHAEKPKAGESAKEPKAGESAKEPGTREASEKPKGGEPAAEESSGDEGAVQKQAADEPTSGESAGGEPSGGESPSGAGEGTTPGQEAAAAEPALATTSTRQIVQLELDAAEQGLAKVGKSAPVTLPDGNTVKGHITDVGKVAESAEGAGPEGGGEGGEPTISVTVALDHPVAHLDEAPVSVELVKAVRSHVLAVPATALFATAGGRYAIEALKDGRPVQLQVTPGMFADGYVQVEGHGIHAGLEVLEPTE